MSGVLGFLCLGDPHGDFYLDWMMGNRVTGGWSRTVREPGGAIPPGYSLETIVMS